MVNQSKIRVIVPFAAKSTVSDWETSCKLLRRTISSILALPTEFASVCVVGHDLPIGVEFSDRCDWLSIEGDPPDRLDYKAKLSDKGIKISTGVKKAYKDGHDWTMFVDADDLINRNLPLYCELDQYDAVCFEGGYSWNEKSHLLLKIPHFHQLCGTSWIMKLTPIMFPNWLGEGGIRVCDLAHNTRFDSLTKIGARIQLLDKPMAMYSVGHESAMNYYKSFWYSFPTTISSLKTIVKLILYYRPITSDIKKNFGLQ